MESSRVITPADGDDYTYDLRTGPELARLRMESIEARLRIVEEALRLQVRDIEERLGQVEYLIKEHAADF